MTGESSPSRARIPKAASTYAPSTVDTELRSDINARLLQDGHIQNIHNKMVHALEADPKNWKDLVKKRAQELIRSREATTFDEATQLIIQEIARDTAREEKSNGTNGVNGSATNASLALPKGVVEEGMKVTRAALDQVVVEDGES
ncbi:hypothetical protein B0O99DRAFT_503327 [Bisporella sp. PMI_857]|nr:hypothetical protein B0O99DRAFT_504216 [Bisporella sp. PMI_857]KAH8600475.1 hypothetical protein B0O99DRAFT_503327 [Bisporella sp. PMI_857]